MDPRFISLLERFGIDVVAVAPGFTRSELSPDFDFDEVPLRPMSATTVARRGSWLEGVLDPV